MKKIMTAMFAITILTAACGTTTGPGNKTPENDNIEQQNFRGNDMNDGRNQNNNFDQFDRSNNNNNNNLNRRQFDDNNMGPNNNNNLGPNDDDMLNNNNNNNMVR